MCTIPLSVMFFFFNDTATTEIYTLSLHDALPISLALGTTAPVASVIVPFSDAVDCASAAGVKHVKSTTNNRKKEKTFRACIDPFKSTAIIMFLQVEILSQALIKFCEPILGR